MFLNQWQSTFTASSVSVPLLLHIWIVSGMRCVSKLLGPQNRVMHTRKLQNYSHLSTCSRISSKNFLNFLSENLLRAYCFCTKTAEETPSSKIKHFRTIIHHPEIETDHSGNNLFKSSDKANSWRHENSAVY